MSVFVWMMIWSHLCRHEVWIDIECGVHACGIVHGATLNYEPPDFFAGGHEFPGDAVPSKKRPTAFPGMSAFWKEALRNNHREANHKTVIERIITGRVRFPGCESAAFHREAMCRFDPLTFE